MFGTLLESSHRRRRRSRMAVVSVVAHAVAITLASAATRAPGSTPAAAPPDLTIVYHAPPPLPTVPVLRGGGPPGSGRPAAPIDVAPVLPPIGPVAIDLVTPVSSGEAIGEPLARTSSDSGAGAGPRVAPGGVYEVVERPAAVLPGAPVARYPESLRRAGVDGEVLLRFVVDTAGRVEPGSIVTVRATHPLFDEAVRRALASTRYAPAEVGGRHVRQLVEQAFAFAIHE